MHLQAGALLKNGEYKIEKVLGQGGFGITYLAEQTSLGRKVALKEFFMEGLCNRDAATSHVSVPSVGSKKLVERFKQKFIKEARNIASLEHKHIVPIIDVFEENGTAYYVMKYFSGGSLSFNSAIPEDVALRYTKQLASALRFIHQKRMMHLDIKPSNILLDDEGNVVLIDFGLAKQYDNAGQQTSTTPVGISHGYAPIEQYRSGGVSAFSPATDIYSLGATLYKLLTGTTPPEAMDIVATGLPACPANVSAETWNAVKSAMQPAASSRPQSVDEFLSLLSENGKNKEGNDGETELNGNVKGASKREGENLFTHTASESSFDEVKGENGKLVADEFHSIDVVEVPDSADAVISNEGEKSQSDDAVILNASEKSHSANNEILPPYSRQNDKDGNEKAASKREGENLFTHTASESSFDEVKVERRNEKEHSAGAVISNGGEKSQKNKPGKSLWLILLLLLIAVAGAWFVFNGTLSTNTSPKSNFGGTSETVNLEITLMPVHDSITGKYGYVNKNDSLVIPFKYDDAEDFSEGLACVGLYGKYGFINKNDTEVIPFRFDDAENFSEGLAYVELDDKCGYIDKSGKEVVPCKYDYVEDFFEGLAYVELDDKEGYVDKSGKEVVPCKYDDVEEFKDGLAYVELDGKCGYVDKSGKEVVPCKYDDVEEFEDGLAYVELDGKCGYVDKSGKEVVPCKYDDVEEFKDGLVYVELDGKCGYVDNSGKEVVPCKYDDVEEFEDGLAYVELDGKCGYVDKSGKEVVPCKYDYVEEFEDGLAYAELDGKCGYVDNSGKEVIPFKYDGAGSFSEGLAPVKSNDKWGFIDKNDDLVVPFKYDGAQSFSEGFAAVELKDKWGFIDKKGKIVIPYEFDYAVSFHCGMARVRLNDKEFFIDKSGKEYIK